MIFRNEINIPHGKLHRGDKCFVEGVECHYLGSYRIKDEVKKEPWMHLFLASGEIPTIIGTTETSGVSLDVVDE